MLRNALALAREFVTRVYVCACTFVGCVSLGPAGDNPGRMKTYDGDHDYCDRNVRECCDLFTDVA